MLCNDIVVLVDNTTRAIVQSMDARAIVISQRHEPRVGDAPATREASFSLFWNRGQGRTEHFVLLAPNAEMRHTWLAQLQRVLFSSVNQQLDGQQKKAPAGKKTGQADIADSKARRVQYYLVRERKPGQGRVNDFGAEYHFMIW